MSVNKGQLLREALERYDKARTEEEELHLAQRVQVLEAEIKILERVSKKMFDILYWLLSVDSISKYDRMSIQTALDECVNRYLDAEAEIKRQRGEAE